MDTADLAHAVWLSKYRLQTTAGAAESHVGATWQRVANAVAAAERHPERWAQRFAALLADYRFLPGGRVLAGAGSDRDVTLFNCFVAGRLDDSLEGILRGLGETARTMQQGGGIGIDFSPLRPAGTATIRTGATASGPVSFMALWDTLCATLLSTTARRGAMMGTLACDHPDVEAFVGAKARTGALTNFNLSVLVSDAFMRAVEDDAPWPLFFPSRLLPGGERAAGEPQATIAARGLWRRIAESAHAHAEPGVLFVDTINRENNLYYCETISATNPCGEIPLPPHGCCDLGSINLAAFVGNPFAADSRLDLAGIRDTARLAVRFLDDIIDVSRFPLDAQATEARKTRRVGLGVTGLADALAMLGLRYSSAAGRGLAVEVLETIRDSAYATSIDLAEEKGPFPRFVADSYLAAPFVSRLPAEMRTSLSRHGIRNSHLLSIAPAGTISLLAGNVSSGIEPIFAVEATRGIRDAGGELHEHAVRDYAYSQWLASKGGEALPAAFETAADLPARAHLEMQAALQPYVDNAISKTINLPAAATVDDVAMLYTTAHAAGIKGCTVYREGASVGRILGRRRPDTHCCTIDREAD
jgi:ribonucleoside-diphosphate reductase alpha chain